jgi:hypothetical protein
MYKTKNGEDLPNDHKTYQIGVKYIKLQYTVPNDLKISQQFPFQGTPKYTLIGIFGLLEPWLEWPEMS